jgi:hypothetical protein
MEETLRLNNQPGGFAMEGLPLTLLIHLSQTPKVKVSLSFLYPTRMDGLFEKDEPAKSEASLPLQNLPVGC